MAERLTRCSPELLCTWCILFCARRGEQRALKPLRGSAVRRTSNADRLPASHRSEVSSLNTIGHPTLTLHSCAISPKRITYVSQLPFRLRCWIRMGVAALFNPPPREGGGWKGLGFPDPHMVPKHFIFRQETILDSFRTFFTLGIPF